MNEQQPSEAKGWSRRSTRKQGVPATEGAAQKGSQGAAQRTRKALPPSVEGTTQQASKARKPAMALPESGTPPLTEWGRRCQEVVRRCSESAEDPERRRPRTAKAQKTVTGLLRRRRRRVRPRAGRGRVERRGRRSRPVWGTGANPVDAGEVPAREGARSGRRRSGRRRSGRRRSGRRHVRRGRRSPWRVLGGDGGASAGQSLRATPQSASTSGASPNWLRSGRHRDTDTTPGSSRVRPSKKRANCSGVRSR